MVRARLEALIIGVVLAVTTGSVVAPAHSEPAAPAAPVAPLVARALDVPTALDATGRSDVTAGLNAFLASVPDDSVVRFPAGARYRIDETVEMVDKSRVLVEGNGAVLFATTVGDRGRAHFAITHGTDITVRSLVIRGANRQAGPDGPYIPSLEAQHGVRLLGDVRVRLENLTISQVYGDMIYVARTTKGATSHPPRASSSIVITKCRLLSSGRQGIALTTAQRVLIDSNVISGARRSVIDMEPNNAALGGVSDVTISHNTVTPGRFNLVGATGNGPVNTIWIQGNRGVGKALSVVIDNQYGAGRTNWRITGNVSDQTYGSAKIGVVVAKGVSGVVYKNNVQPTQRGVDVVGLIASDGTCGAVSTGNRLDGAPQFAGSTVPCGPEVVLRAPDPPDPAMLPTGQTE